MSAEDKVSWNVSVLAGLQAILKQHDEHIKAIEMELENSDLGLRLKAALSDKRDLLANINAARVDLEQYALEAYAEKGEKTVHPAVQVRVGTELTYPLEKAVAYCAGLPSSSTLSCRSSSR
jgi:hypothetical protein